jgi:hypothetical protein
VTSYEVASDPLLPGIVVGADAIGFDAAVAGVSLATHAHALDDLTDVDASTVAPALDNYLKYDGAGQWRPAALAVPSAEVVVQTAAPTFTADGIWGDITAPGPPPATVQQYVAKTGDTMSGPLVLSGAPTLLTQAGRWADGRPRFADAAARDAAYATIGGPLSGMECWLVDLRQAQTWNGARWAPTGGVLPSLSISLRPNKVIAASAGGIPMTGAVVELQTPDGPTYNSTTGVISGGVPGFYAVSFQFAGIVDSQVSWKNPAIGPAITLGSFAQMNAYGGMHVSVLATQDILDPGYTRQPLIWVRTTMTTPAVIYHFLTLTYICDF